MKLSMAVWLVLGAIILVGEIVYFNFGNHSADCEYLMDRIESVRSCKETANCTVTSEDLRLMASWNRRLIAHHCPMDN